MKLRVIGGKDKGRNLVGKVHQKLRPTSQKTKEALFDILGSVENTRFLDIFAGTGQIGIEAKSRGASNVTFVERSRQAIVLLEKNVGEVKDVRIVQGDVFIYLKKSKEDPFDLIFADPPYFLSFYKKIFDCLMESEVVKEETILVLEHHESVEIPEREGVWKREKLKRYGDTCLSFYRRVKRNTVSELRRINYGSK